MANRLREAVALHTARLQAYASESITYRRGANAVTLTASLGSQLLRTTDRQGNTKTERTDRDFILTAAKLILGGEQTEPQAGDYVDLTTGTTTERFEVMALPANEPPWRYCDGNKLMLRVHAKFVGVVTTPDPVADEDGDYILIDDDDE